MASKFRFAVLKRVRELREKQQQREMARRLRVILELTNRLHAIREKKNRALRDSNVDRAGGVDIRREETNFRYLRTLEQQRTSTLADMLKAQKELERQRVIVTRAMQERKMMDTLLQKHLEIERMADYREEAGRLSEIAVLRFKPGSERE